MRSPYQKIVRPLEDDEVDLSLIHIYEEHHHVTIEDEALKGAVELADRYVSDRFLPDKAIDVLDEACSRVSPVSYTHLHGAIEIRTDGKSMGITGFCG